MRRIRFFSVAVIFAVAGFGFGYAFRAMPAGETSVLYSLDGMRNSEALIRMIDAAHHYAYFGIYAFTKNDIADALIRARRRGVDVRGIMDGGESRSGVQADIAERLVRAGIPIVFRTRTPGIMHMKLLVTEDAYAVGSYNWTAAATFLNDEVLEIGHDDRVRGEYSALLQRIFAENRSAFPAPP